MKVVKIIKKQLFGEKFYGIRIFPVATKILIVFVIFILLSNLSSHYISLMLYREQMIKLAKHLLVRDLKEIYNFSAGQYEIYQLNKNLDQSIKSIEAKAVLDFKQTKSLLLAVRPDGKIIIQASRFKKYDTLTDASALKILKSENKKNSSEGFITFKFNEENYFAVYKYNYRWDAFFVRGEEFNEFNRATEEVFKKVIIMIAIITFLCAIIGAYLMHYVLRFIEYITENIIRMTEQQKLEIIDLKGGGADDVTFLGMAFNSLSSTVNNLVQIFQKFTSKDIVQKAYKDKYISLEGSKRELTCLFSDIKSFTYMTEVLGTEIITLLNIHYKQVIDAVLKHDGIVGSIIGDALLAVYGVFEDESAKSKSFKAVLTGYHIHRGAEQIREKMNSIRKKILLEKESLTPEEESVFRAVMIEVGVGIDGGMVFYGNIGSDARMTTTVIGDNVNSASRLEALNRIYRAPVICSEYIKDDIEKNVANHGLRFLEIDTVIVKGKTAGKKIFWPILTTEIDDEMDKALSIFSAGLEYYYAGNWKAALDEFALCSLPVAEVFIERTKNNKNPPSDWNSIWTMESK